MNCFDDCWNSGTERDAGSVFDGRTIGGEIGREE